MRSAVPPALGLVGAPAAFWGTYALDAGPPLVLAVAAPLAVMAVFAALRRLARPGDRAWPLALAMLAGIWLALTLRSHIPVTVAYDVVFGLPLASLALFFLGALGPRRGTNMRGAKTPGEFVLRESPRITGSGR